VLVLKAIGYRPYLKIQNLFLPCGQTLWPPLRRDQVRKLLAADPATINWLAPAEGNCFTPESMPDNAFRPLFDWVDYVLDRDRESLDVWMQACRFDFDAFTCDEDGEPKPRKPPSTPERGKGARSVRGNEPKDRGSKDVSPFAEVESDAVSEVPTIGDELDVAPAPPSELELRRRALEDEFLAVEGGLDAPERVRMWPELASLNAALKNALDDAGVCWMNALWPQENAAAEYAWRWFRTEAMGLAANSWAGRIAGRRNGEPTGDDIDRLLAIGDPASADVRALAALIVWTSTRNPVPAALRERLNPVQQFLEKHERRLPVRAAWLAWYHLAKLSGGDVLALAHARDRLLERLFQNGLRPEQDLPSFLRFAGQPSNQRFRAVRNWLAELPEAAKEWSAKSNGPETPAKATAAYIDLIFAFGLARLGERDVALARLQHAQDAMKRRDDVHAFLVRAFEYRIRQAADIKPHAGPLSNELMDELKPMEKMQRYIAERLMQRSRILEPHQTVDAYRHWTLRDDPLGKELAELIDVRDRKDVEERVRRMFADVPRGAAANEKRSRILRVALEQSPRVGEEFARDLLTKVSPVYDALAGSSDLGVLENQANLLEKALAAAAHFDRSEFIHPLVDRFKKMLSDQKGDAGARFIEAVGAQCFRGLRKLGMREEIDTLLGLMAQMLLSGQDPKSLDAASTLTHMIHAIGGTDLKGLETPQVTRLKDQLRPLLHVAGGWYYFGRDRQADPLMRMVWTVLTTTPDPVEQRQQGKSTGMLSKDRAELACTYALTAGQTPVEAAQKRLEELFVKLPPIKDTLTTQSHYFLLHLNVVEAAVLAVVSDDFTMGTNARRWLDEDEYLVRKRIHRDLRRVKGAV
jgi:hypothetical protein